MRKYFPYLLILFLLSASAFFFIFRSEPTKFSEVIIDGKISISVPEYLSKTDSIDPSAILQYQNVNSNVFLVAYEERSLAGKTLQEFFKDFSDNLIAGIENGALLKYYPEKINGHNAFIGNIRGSVNETKVYYRVAVIESSNNMYRIIFGVGDGNQSTYYQDMDKIIRGFKIRS